MQLFKLLTLGSLPIFINAYSNVALRYDELLKRSNETYPTVSESTSQLTTEIATYVPTTDAYGQPTTILTTQTITYYTTIQQSSDASVAPSSTSPDETLTSYILTTITLPESSTSVESIPTTITTDLSTTASSSNDLQALNTGLNFGANANQLASSGVESSYSSSIVESSIAPSVSISTVTVTVQQSDCYPTTVETITNKIPITGTFTLTGTNGDVFTLTTSTEVDQTTTQIAYITSTLTPTVTASISSYSNGTESYPTSTIANTYFFGNGTSSGAILNAVSSSTDVEELTKRSFIRRFYDLF